MRIPADVALALGLKEGVVVQLRALEAGELAVITERERRAATIQAIRQLAVHTPPGFKFDRDEANSR